MVHRFFKIPLQIANIKKYITIIKQIAQNNKFYKKYINKLIKNKKASCSYPNLSTYDKHTKKPFSHVTVMLQTIR